MADDHGLVARRLPTGTVVWEVPAPTHCPNGHSLEPGKVTVGFVLCSCDKVRARSRGHNSWRCRCGATVYADGHTDDTQLAGAEHWAPNNGITQPGGSASD